MLMNINERFNKELLWQIEGRLPKGHIYKLGMPSEALLSAGIENLAVEITASTLKIKSSMEYKSKHPFDLSDVINLPNAILYSLNLQNPIFYTTFATLNK
ncbi:MAG: hypothetical protein RR190_05880 [Bacteroidales bacterium]